MNVIQKILQKYWPFFIILILWLLFSSPYFFKGLVPFPSKYLVSFFPPWSASYAMPVKNNAMPDVITQIYPWKKFTVETWKKGEIPLWNPYGFSGTTHAGNYQSAVFSPLNIVFFLMPFVDAWSILILLQPLLAGLFMLLFLRELGCSKTSSTIGSVGFMFCGFLVTWMAYGTLGYAALFLPLILWSIRRYMRNGSVIAFCIGALGVTWSFLSGHFQISVYVLGVSLCYLLFETAQSQKRRQGIMLVIMLCVGILLSAPQLYLTYDAFQASVRSIITTQLKEVIPWQYLITFLSPDFYGNPVTRNDWFGHYAEWAGYVGVIPLLLSLYAVFFSHHSKKVFFTGLFLVSLLLAYISPLSVTLFQLKIPVLSMSAASRIIVITSFSLCVLGAIGFEQLALDWKKEYWRKRIAFAAGPALILCFIWGVVYIFKPLPSEWLHVAKRNLLLPTALALAASGVIAFGFLKKWNGIYIASFALIFLCCFDSYRYAAKWMPFDPKEYVYPPVKVISLLQKEIGQNRVFGNIGNEVGSYFGIPLIEGYDAMYQGRYGEFINSASNGIVSTPGRSVVQFDKHGRYALPTLQLLGVKYILHRISDGRNVWAFPYWQYGEVEFKSLYRDEHYELLEYRHAFPRVFLASSYVVKTDSQEIIDALFQKDFDRRNTIVLERKPTSEPMEGEGTIEEIRNTPTSLIVRIKNSVPKLLFRSDVFDPGWNVTIDNKPSPLYRADYDFQAVLVPEGDHVVKFSYRPKSFTYGIYSMIIGIGIIIGVVVMNIKKTL
jgi:Ca2+/Na+ antiporter